MSEQLGVPEGYHTVNAYQIVSQAEHLVEFAVNVFNAQELERVKRADGTIGHAELRIGDSLLMVSEASKEWPAMPAALYLYVPDCDAVYERAIAAGGEGISAPRTQFYGDRHAAVRGPCGELWWISTRIETLTSEQLQSRAREAMGGR